MRRGASPCWVRVKWQPGVRVRSAPSLSGRVLGVVRCGALLECEAPPEEWATLAHGAGFVRAVLETGTAHGASVLEVVEGSRSPVELESLDAEAGADADGPPQPWSAGPRPLPEEVGDGQSFKGAMHVRPPTAHADALIAYVRAQLRRKHSPGDASFGMDHRSTES